jgi:hypothetical protein
MKERRTVLIELVIAAPIEDVWQAFRDPAEIARWFGWQYPGLTAEIAAIFVSGATADEGTRSIAIPQTGDLFSLEPNGSHTLVRMTRAAPTDGSWDDIYDDVVEGWRTFLQQLRFAFAHHRRDNRGTIYLAGRVSPETGPHPIAALGLTSLAVRPVGNPFAVRLPTGDTLHGLVWFHSTYQIGLTVAEFGNGLLVASRRPKTAGAAREGGAVILTFYGPARDELVAYLARWHTWWTRSFEQTSTYPSLERP